MNSVEDKIFESSIVFSKDLLEKYLLKKILTDKSYMNICSAIYDKRWISDKNIGISIKLAINYFKKYSSVPSVKTIKSIFKKYIEASKTDIDFKDVSEAIDSAINTDFNADENIINTNLKAFIRKQALWCSIIDSVDNIEKNSDVVLEKILQQFDNVTKITFNDKNLGLEYFSDSGLEEHWKYIKNPEARISTGWSSIDKYTNGGLLKDGRSLYVFMGQAGLGKSLFLSNITVNLLKQNLKVVVISLEMSQDVYAQRFDAHISNSNINKLKDNAETAIANIKKFYSDYPESNLIIKEYPPRSIRPSDIELYLENLKLSGKTFDAVVIDYLNLVLPQSHFDGMYQGVQNVAEKLRSLSYKFSCPFISATQANREGMNNENIGLENISESAGIGHTVDFLVGLYQMPDDRENGFIKARILKSRFGIVGTVSTFVLNSETLVLSDITLDSHMAEDMQASEASTILKNLPEIADDLGDL